NEIMASYGWIVAAPDHHDKYSFSRIRPDPSIKLDKRDAWREIEKITRSSPKDRPQYLYRLDEMQFALNSMLAVEPFRAMIDNNRIAVGGHSFGGFTALGLCGTIPDRHDPRIRAVLVFSSGASGYLYRPEEIANVRIPSMMFIGEKEEEDKRGEQTMGALTGSLFQHLPSPKYFLEVKGAGHFSFNNQLTNTFASRFFSGTREQFDVINRYSVAFLEKYVAGHDAAANAVLESKDPLLTRFLQQ
ncbi:MAG: hypothetical protein PHY92_06870, partial [Alphaproteobacteria bacterium]|nr:hypothetical protein [Alphaproteobacteria bacterium]